MERNKNLIGVSGRSGSGKDTVGNIIRYLVTDWDKLISEYDSTTKPTYPEYLESGWNKETTSGWEIKKFDNAVTRSYKEITGIDKSKLIGEAKELERPRYVEFAQKCKDIFGEDVWVKALFSKYKALGGYSSTNGKLSCRFYDKEGKFSKDMFISNLPDVDTREYPSWIITDLRFPNELKAVKDRGGISIRVNRDESINPFKSRQKGMSEAVFTKVKQENHPSETALDNAEFDYIINNSGTVEELIEKVKEILIKENII